ncbi:MAG: sigma-54 dependent transcriptional regulator [Deltaproteobacteria bacterium]|jgi:DNA-binding NtrC family response regulator|nr:sigma-54 dependent transcriptional regulator [Deltaproteobacteria bacterium]
MNSGRLLVVEDDKVVAVSLKMFLENLNFEVDAAANGTEAWELIQSRDYKIILSDINLPGLHGKEILNLIKQHGVDVELILFTGYGSVSDAVECIKRGAYDYFTKPIDNERLSLSIRHALERKALRDENKGLRHELDKSNSNHVYFRSKSMELLVQKARIAAETEATVLITGDSGTGKTLLAKFIHGCSKKAGQPFVEVSCGALSEGLLESELFGHSKGAFTGADRDKKGRFEAARDGTVFLDDINSASMGLQAKLLKVIEEKTFERVGDTRPMYTAARVVAATNRDLRERSKKGLFREDLFHRLNVVSLAIPKLNDRKEDVPILVQQFLQKFSRKHKRNVKKFDEWVLPALCHYDWPGNVRELENVMERAVIFCRSGEIRLSDLPEEISGLGKKLDLKTSKMNLSDAMQRFEHHLISQALDLNKGNRDKTAKDLGISRATLFNKMKKWSFASGREIEGTGGLSQADAGQG